MRKARLLAAAVAASLCASTVNAAQDRIDPVIAPNGSITPADGAANRPDAILRYQMMFSATKAGTKAGTDAVKPNPGLYKVAPLKNLHGANGIRIQPGDIVAVVRGAATTVVAINGVYATKTKVQHVPSLDLIAKLRAASVVVAVCSEALHANGLVATDVAPGIEIDMSAM